MGTESFKCALLSALMITSIIALATPLLPTDLASALPEETKISIKVDFPAPEITNVGEYHRVTMSGLQSFGNPGEPILPLSTVRVLIPYGREVKAVRVTHGMRVILDGSYYLEPAQVPIPLSFEGRVKPTPPDENIYNSPSPFPTKIHSNPFTQSKRGYKILILNLYPVSYVPAERGLSYFEKMTVEVEIEPSIVPYHVGQRLLLRCSAEDRETISRIVDNPETIDTYPYPQEYTSEPLTGESHLDPSQSYKYVIITDEALQNAWEEKITNGSFANLASGWIFNGVDYDSTPTYLLGYTTNGHTSSYDHTGDGSGSIGVYAQPNWLATDIEEAYWTRSIGPIDTGSKITVKGWYMHVSNVGDTELDEERISIQIREGGTWKTVPGADHTVSGSHNVTNNVWYQLGPITYTTLGEVDQIRVYLYCKDSEGLSGGEEHGIVFDDVSMKVQGETVEYTFQDLVSRKQSRGITATIENIEWIYANYSGLRPDGGVDNQTKIRNFIIDAYNNWGTEYVLLGGDDTVVPFRRFWVEAFDPDDNMWYTANMPSDMYYSCLDGTFDYDNDGYWGEPNDGEDGGEVDFYAEVYVGRAPVASGADVSNVVRKTLAFENFDPENRYLAYMVGEYLGWGGLMDYAKPSLEEIRLGSDAYGYTTEGFVSCGAVRADTLYEENQSWSGDDLINIVNNGVRVLNHLGHGNPYIAMKLYNSDLDSLTNTEYFFAYSQTCSAGHFDGIECWAEKVVRMENGAAAVVMNARYGFGNADNTDGPSQHFAREFWDAAFGENKYNFGVMNSDSKEDQDWYISLSSRGRWCAYGLNLFGDPELHFIPLPMPHDPIYIYGNDNFTPANGVVGGSGTENDPYIIEKWLIDASTAHGIHIQDTTKYFIIRNCLVENGSPSYNGIYLDNVESGRIENCTLKNNDGGINGPLLGGMLWKNGEVENCIFENNNSGIYLNWYCDNITLNNNTVLNNGSGIVISWSESIKMRNNTLENNQHNFAVHGGYILDFVHDIDTSNLVNGKPIRYLVGHSDEVIGPSLEMGYLGLVNCDNIWVENLVLGNNGQGILLARTENSRVENCIFENNNVGIFLHASDYNSFLYNACSNNSGEGILLYKYSDNNIIANNTCSSNSRSGIFIEFYSDGNSLNNNICSNNDGNGIEIYHSFSNFLSYNACSNNSFSGIYTYTGLVGGLGLNNTLDNNTCENNSYGIRLWNSHGNTLSSNTCENNNWAGILLDDSDNNTLDNNVCANNYDGIRLGDSDNNTYFNNICESNNSYGIRLHHSDNNLIYHNNIINNGIQSYDNGSNCWDNGYPSGGNYWSDYAGVDNYRGENQDILGSDGIGDTPYNITGDNNQDRYPFMNPWPVSGTAVFSLENLYKVKLEKDLWLYTGSKLVVKFYTYGDAFENENAIETFVPPVHVEENESARHPEGIGVKKVRLDLTTDDTGNIISTIASFIVRKVNLEARFTEIPMGWALASPAEKVALEIEFSEIPMQWALAPS